MGWRSGVVALTALVLATIAVLVSAGAAPGQTGVGVTQTGTGATQTGAPYGALKALSGPGSCFGDGCPSLRGIPAGGNATLKLTSDRSDWAGTSGQTLYLTSVPDPVGAGLAAGAPWAIAVLDRDRRTGLLSQPPGQRGCITTARPLQGCAFVPATGQVVDLVISPDGTKVAVESIPGGASAGSCVAAGAASSCSSARYLLLARDPQTGTLRRIGGVRRCLVMIDNACGEVRGLRPSRDLTSVALTPNTRILAGSAAGGGDSGAGIAYQQRGAKGIWREPADPSGCTNEHGTAGCHALGCLKSPVTAAAVGGGNRVYVVGGGGKYGTAYVATLRHSGSHGLQVVGCAAFATPSGGAATGTPIWIRSLVHTFTVLIGTRSDDGTGGDKQERLYEATPKPQLGALRQARPLSVSPSFPDGIPALGCNCGPIRPNRVSQTVYAGDAGGLYVYQATPTKTGVTVTALPAPWFNPYSAPAGSNGAYGVTDTPLISPNGRDLYVVTGPIRDQASSESPGIRVYEVQP